MIEVSKTPIDPAWDYSSIWETLGEIQNSLTQIFTLLSSEAAEEGNEKIDVEIRRALAKIKGDCLGIEKALMSEEEVEISADILSLQALEAIAESSRESTSMLRSIDLTLSNVNQTLSQIDGVY